VRSSRLLPATALLPGLAIGVIVAADLAVRRSMVLGLVVAAPLLAASGAGPWVTAGYGGALIAGILLVIADDAYAAGDPLHPACPPRP
jgi:sigma-B regulation protein RsbU (phosphoserine phosphatase)